MVFPVEERETESRAAFDDDDLATQDNDLTRSQTTQKSGYSQRDIETYEKEKADINKELQAIKDAAETGDGTF